MKFYELDSAPSGTTRYTSGYHAGHTWSLPGTQCPTCDEQSQLPEAKLLERACPKEDSRKDPFAQILIQNPWLVLIRCEALEQLQAEGILGLKGCRTQLRFWRQDAPELLELQIESHGLYHPDCAPPSELKPCETCGRYTLSRPEQPVLDGASLPRNVDVFRLRNGTATLVVNERLADTLRRFGFEEFSLRELPVR